MYMYYFNKNVKIILKVKERSGNGNYINVGSEWKYGEGG